jgi:hypothetical protein
MASSVPGYGPCTDLDGFDFSIALAAESAAAPVLKIGATKTKTGTTMRVARRISTPLKGATTGNRNYSKNKGDNENWSGNQPYTKS